ncbi:MAG: HEPN domain-containing protein [Methanobacterium sp. ERen5]|nr:MAG: HEPN domain-containing protein [Methanobacterium sp. ERen5]
MRYQFEKCLDKGKIIRIEIDPELFEKELIESRNDINSARRSIEQGNFKWAIIQTYYSMFHALKGLLLSKGYREKSHICLKHAIEAIFVDTNLLSEDIFEDYDFARRARERADYSYIYMMSNWQLTCLKLLINLSTKLKAY